MGILFMDDSENALGTAVVRKGKCCTDCINSTSKSASITSTSFVFVCVCVFIAE